MTVKNAQCCVASPRQLRRVSPEVCGNAEDHNQHGVVDVEAVGDEGEHAHRAHDLQGRERGVKQGVCAVHGRHFTPRCRARATHGGVGGLLLLLVGDGRVHVDQTQEVQTQGRRQTTEQPAGPAQPGVGFFSLSIVSIKFIYWKKCWSGDTEKVFFASVLLTCR